MLATGTRLGAFEILGPLGSGGMGEVYRARDTRLSRQVAIKVLPADVATDPERLRRFEQEARAASALNHPNIVTIHEIGREGATVFLVMEHVEGRTLREILRDGPVPVRRALGYIAQAATGLAKAHGAGIVHRDIKPENLMVSADGVVKILDFGLAKTRPGTQDATSRLDTTAEGGTSPGVLVGTTAYMSPEQARGAAVDFRSDQFSLGSVLYEILAGKGPFEAPTVPQKLAAIIEKDHEPLSRHRDDIPAPVRWMTDRCLAKDPADRYASTIDLARDLRSALDHISEIGPGTAEAGAPAGPAPATRRTGRAAGMLAGLAIGAALMWGWFAAMPDPEVSPPSIRTTTFSGFDREPAASPDGRNLAFASRRDGLLRIWLKQMAGGAEAPLTEGPFDSLPVFSPDGTAVLFTRQVSEGRSALFRVPLLGGEPRRVVDDAVSGDWSPDGRRVAFLRWTEENAVTLSLIGLVDVDGGNERIIGTIRNAAATYPRFSPDGQWVITPVQQFGISEAGGKFFVMARADGQETRRIDPPGEGGDLSAVAWLGNGREIIYAQGESVTTVSLGSTFVNSGASRIIRHDVFGGESLTLFWMPNLIRVVDLVEPGHVVFDAMTSRENLYEFPAPSGGAPGRPLSPWASLDRQPVYSPEGRWIAFSSNRSGNLDIWAVSTETGEARRLTDDLADDWDPAFTADGRHLIWTSRRSGNFEIWMANQDGSGARQVTRDGVDAENATATRDGRWLIYNSGNPAHPGLWRIRPDGTDATRLVPGTVAWPEVSPDGRFASYCTTPASGVRVIRVARVEDGTVLPFEITLEGTQGSNGRSRWMPDSRAIAFNWSTSERGGIYAQDFAENGDTSATRRPLAEFDLDVLPESFGISPDGARLTVAVVSGSIAIVSARDIPNLDPPGR